MPSGEPPARLGWHRPVRPLALVLVGGGVLLVWLVLVALSVWYFYEHWEARMTLRDQAVRLRLPPGMQALAEVSQALRSHVDLRPEVRVPVRQTVSATVSEAVQARVQLHTRLPVDTTVHVDQMVTVHTTLNTRVALKSWLPSFPVSLPVTLTLPLRMDVPVRAEIPVDLDLWVRGQLPSALAIPIDQTFVLRPHVQADITAHLLRQTAFELVGPIAPFPVTIEQAHLSVPFKLGLLKRRAP